MDSFEKLEALLGSDKAEEVKKEVESGERSMDEVEDWADKLWDNYEKHHNRPDIEPEDWQKFEDGWRPENW